MRTRTRILICVGLLAAAVGVVLVLSLAIGPTVEVTFVRYAEDGGAVLALTNRGSSTALFSSTVVFRSIVGGAVLIPEHRLAPRTITNLPPIYTLAPHEGMQLVAMSSPWSSLPFAALPSKLSVICTPEPSPLRRHAEALLHKVGINIDHTVFGAHVTLPPRPMSASPSPP